MARGRMLNKTISLDQEVADLVNEVGPLAGIAYTWAIAHLDRDGRITGEPRVFIAEVAPLLSGLTPELVRSMLVKAHQLGLICLYESGGKFVVEYPKFQQNQQGLRYEREAASRYPEYSGVTPDLVRQLPAEVKVKQCKSMEGKVTSLSTSHGEADRGRREQILEVFGHYRKHHPRAASNPSTKSKEWRAVDARLRDGFTVDDLRQAIDGCHKTPHNIGQNDRGQKYLGLELITRSADQVTRFIENDSKFECGVPPMNSAFGRSYVECMQEAAEYDAKNGIHAADVQVEGSLPKRGNGRPTVEGVGRRLLGGTRREEPDCNQEGIQPSVES